VYGLLENHQDLPSLTLMTVGMHKMPFVTWMVIIKDVYLLFAF
jgi:hypothetical protein